MTIIPSSNDFSWKWKSKINILNFIVSKRTNIWYQCLEEKQANYYLFWKNHLFTLHNVNNNVFQMKKTEWNKQTNESLLLLIYQFNYASKCKNWKTANVSTDFFLLWTISLSVLFWYFSSLTELKRKQPKDSSNWNIIIAPAMRRQKKNEICCSLFKWHPCIYSTEWL